MIRTECLTAGRRYMKAGPPPPPCPFQSFNRRGLVSLPSSPGLPSVGFRILCTDAGCSSHSLSSSSLIGGGLIARASLARSALFRCMSVGQSSSSYSGGGECVESPVTRPRRSSSVAVLVVRPRVPGRDPVPLREAGWVDSLLSGRASLLRRWKTFWKEN